MPSTPPRARLARRLLVAAAVLLALLVVAALALPALIDVNRYRGLIQEKAEAVLGRKVTLGPMALSVLPLPGIDVEGIEVEGLLKASALEVRVKLWSLLTGSPEVTRLILRQPVITLRRGPDGAWDTPFASAAPEEAGAASPAGAGSAVSLAGLKVEEGLLKLRDERRGRPPVDLEAQVDLSASLDRLPSGDLDSSFELSAATEGITLQARGVVQRAAGRTTADITLDRAQADMEKLRRLAGDFGLEWPIAAGLIEPGEITLGARLQARREPGQRAGVALSDVVLSGLKLNLAQDAQGRWSWEQKGPAPEPAPEPAPGEGIDLTVRNLRLADATLKLGGATSAARGLTVNDLTVVVEEIAPSRPLAFQLAGRFDRGGKIDAGGAVPGTLNMDLELGRSDLRGTVTVKKTDPVDAVLDLSSRRTDFGELIEILESLQPQTAAAGPRAPGVAPRSRSVAEGAEAASIQGRLAIAEGTFGGMSFNDLQATLVMERDRVRLEPVSMKLYGGRMKGSVGMNMAASPAAFTVGAQAEQVDSDALLAAALDLGGMLAGTMSGQFSIAASGASRDEVLAGARGEGSLRLTDGRVGAVSVLGVLSKASGVLGERSLAEVSHAMATQGTDFSEMSATFTVRDGKVHSEDLKLVSKDLNLAGQGSFDMRAAALQMAGEINFSQALSQAMVDEKSRAAEYFWDSDRARVSLPLALSGPVASPTPSIDWQKAGGRLARRKVEEGLGKRLEEAGLGGILKKGTSPQRTATGKPAAPADPAALDAIMEESGFSGSLLAPDLKLKGELRGAGLQRAQVTVRDASGRVLHEESFDEKIRKYYAAHDPAAPAAVNFRVTVDGKNIPTSGRGSLEVLVTLVDAAGKTVERRFEVDR